MKIIYIVLLFVVVVAWVGTAILQLRGNLTADVIKAGHHFVISISLAASVYLFRNPSSVHWFGLKVGPAEYPNQVISVVMAIVSLLPGVLFATAPIYIWLVR